MTNMHQHASDCSLHNEPALPAGPCDCWVAGWQTMDNLPKDRTVLVSVAATEKPPYLYGQAPSTLPAYIDPDGRFCDCGSWKPDAGLDGPHFRAERWMELPPPYIAPQRSMEGV